MIKNMMQWVLGVMGVVGLSMGTFADNVVKTGYETGFADVARMCGELHRALGAKERNEILPQPDLWKEVVMPFVQPGLSSDGSREWRSVQLSAGLVDFLNQVAHARAIDLRERGFLKKYLSGLAAETGERPLAGLPVAQNQQVWTFDTMNHQISHFNQMAASLMAIAMAQHYLGYHDKYASQLMDSQHRTVPINSALKETEWRKAVLAGAHNALSCGFGVEGLKVLLETIDALPDRPAWTLYFVPPHVKVAKVCRELEKLEKNFFLME